MEEELLQQLLQELQNRSDEGDPAGIIVVLVMILCAMLTRGISDFLERRKESNTSDERAERMEAMLVELGNRTDDERKGSLPDQLEKITDLLQRDQDNQT